MVRIERQIAPSKISMRWRFLGLIFLLVLAACGGETETESDSVGDQPRTESTKKRVKRSLSGAALAKFQHEADAALARLSRGARASVLITDLETNATLFERSPSAALVPASNMKLLTGSAFLAHFGTEHQLSTRFMADGRVDENGVLHGDLIVVGGGDPSLNGRHFDGDSAKAIDLIASNLEARGLRHIKGRILADGRLFKGPATGDNWPKDGPWNRWMVEVSALVFNENRTSLQCRVDEGRPSVEAQPDVDYVKIENRLSVRPSSQQIIVSRGADDNRFVVSGSVRTDSLYDADVNVHDGDLYYVTALARALETRGIDAQGIGKVEDERVLPEGPSFMDFVSRADTSLAVMLSESQNLYAELFFRLVGQKIAGEGSFHGGTAALYAWLDTAGIRDPQTVIADGSGLSRDNRVSAHQFADVLSHMQKSPAVVTLREAMAQPSHEGTLKKRMPTLEGRLFAKTGTLNGVSALSGYLQLPDETWAAFSMLFNDVQVSRARSIQDEICIALSRLEP